MAKKGRLLLNLRLALERPFLRNGIIFSRHLFPRTGKRYGIAADRRRRHDFYGRFIMEQWLPMFGEQGLHHISTLLVCVAIRQPPKRWYIASTIVLRHNMHGILLKLFSTDLLISPQIRQVTGQILPGNNAYWALFFHDN
jgi:hypothetical protein